MLTCSCALKSPDVTLYYQTDGSTTTIKSVTYGSKHNLSTTSIPPLDNWKPVPAASGFNSLPGSSLATYGKQCEFCNQASDFIPRSPSLSTSSHAYSRV